ncbi:unnamed protein product [Cyclocybe aegerita]|uniref:Uncharacterized protein n=1 Tax=Cyclocybe aegerita TaxID=1973307 RepID=A0A8S0X5H3_CYCAE|nr:unnamed protein product [Cyclocybe aegerita]
MASFQQTLDSYPKQDPDEILMEYRFRIFDLVKEGILPPLPFCPKSLFFYGTLSLPHVLQKVLDLEALKSATARGFLQKMWGPYPALIEYRMRLPDSSWQTLGCR